MGERARSEQVITPEGRLSYPNLFHPRSFRGGKPMYEAVIIFPLGTNLDELKKVYRQCAMEAFDGKKPPGFLSPFKVSEQKGMEGCQFIRVKTAQPPGLVGPDKKEITNPRDLFPGCYVRASVNAFSYNNMGNKGVSFGLNNLQKTGGLKEGDEPFGSWSTAEQDFDEVEQLESDDKVAPGNTENIFE